MVGPEVRSSHDFALCTVHNAPLMRVACGCQVARSTRARLATLYDRVVEVQHIPAPQLDQPDQPSWVNSGMDRSCYSLVYYLFWGASMLIVRADTCVLQRTLS